MKKLFIALFATILGVFLYSMGYLNGVADEQEKFAEYYRQYFDTVHYYMNQLNDLKYD